LVGFEVSPKGERTLKQRERHPRRRNAAGIPMYEAGSQRFEISAFVISDYLVYFISDLDKQRNTQLMQALAPQAQGFIASVEL
jgi:hypothetical protein